MFVMSVAPEPPGSRLPTGNELMSGPISSGGVTRQQKEIEFVMNNIETRLESLKKDEGYQTHKALLFSICVCFAMGGVTLVLYGLHKTFFFEKYKNEPTNIPALVFGGLFMCPMFYWFYYLYLPNKDEIRRRKRIAMDRKDRRKPTLFNQLVEEARKATEPPPRRIRILAHIRKHDYPIVASTMEELTDAIANQCGLAVERQLLRHNDVDLDIQLDKKLDVFYGLTDNDRVYVYNKGGFFTADSPLKKAKRVDIMHMNDEMERGEARPETSGGRPSVSAGGGRPSLSQQGGRNSIGTAKSGLKSAMSEGRESLSRDSIGSEKRKGNISWKS